MNKLARMAATSHSLSMSAMEEASRTGERTADLEHLLMALSLSEQPAGQVLRGLGVNLDALRAALAGQRSAQLSSLGVDLSDQSEQRIVFHETGGYEWSKRALDVLGQVGKGDGGASAVLRTLLEEPSGSIDELLVRAGTTTGAVRARLAEVETMSTDAATYSRTTQAVSRVSHVFIPASPVDVWALLSDPTRVPEWETAIAEIEPLREGAIGDVGDRWNARTITHYPDGKPVRMKDGLSVQHVELVARDEPTRVAWRFRYPERPDANTRLLAFVVEPAAGGTQLGITFTWERASQSQRTIIHSLFGLLMRPAMRFALWIQASQLGAAISRVFR